MIRRAVLADVPQLLLLMQKLAEFEGYADRFVVTQTDLIERGFSTQRAPEFVSWVADDNDVLQGYAVVYEIPFTFDLRPTVVLKELLVDDKVRGKSFGDKLFATVVQHAQSINARLIRWQVLPNNELAKKFYRGRGGDLDSGWESWVLSVDNDLLSSR